MSVPASVKIGPDVYQVLVDELENRRAAVDTGHLSIFGSATHSDLKITMDPDQQPMVMRDTLLHEVLHGIFRLTNPVEPETEERVICALSTMLLDTLRRNPRLVDYLMAVDADAR